MDRDLIGFAGQKVSDCRFFIVKKNPGICGCRVFRDGQGHLTAILRFVVPFRAVACPHRIQIKSAAAPNLQDMAPGILAGAVGEKDSFPLFRGR